MPIPHSGESESTFIKRCFEYPDLQDRPKDQRLAICYSLYKEYKKEKSMDSIKVQSSNPFVNEEEMSIVGILASGELDRDGDIIDPQGVQTDLHKLNPVVYYNHGMGGRDLPIAKCEDKNGNYTVWVDEQNRLMAKCFFVRDDPFSEQIFNLMANKVITGMSLRATPKIKEPIRGRGDHVKQCTLVEASIVALPCDAYACQRVLEKNEFEKMLPEVQDILKSVIDTPMTDIVKAESASNESEGGALREPAAVPHGAEAIQKLHKALIDIHNDHSENAGKLEGKVKANIERVLNKVKDMACGLQDHYAANYADQKPLENCMKSEDEKVEEAKEENKEKNYKEDLNTIKDLVQEILKNQKPEVKVTKEEQDKIEALERSINRQRELILKVRGK